MKEMITQMQWDELRRKQGSTEQSETWRLNRSVFPAVLVIMVASW
jgi:hypothetical protein